MPADGTSGNPGRSSSVDLREYIERILAEREKAQEAVFKSAMREADTRSRELERRLEGLNELRAEVLRDRERFVERGSYDLTRESTEQRLNSIEQWNAKMIGIGLVLLVLFSSISALIGVWLKY